jgi:hypothetical protein
VGKKKLLEILEIACKTPWEGLGEVKNFTTPDKQKALYPS